MAKWLDQFTRTTHTFDRYTSGFGYACAYTNGQPQPISGHRGLIHSTEGSSLPDYQGGRTNPNFTVDPWRKRRYQHVPSDVAARATMANNSMFVQIEIIGFCDLAYAKKYGMQSYYLETMGADELAYIAESLAIIGDANGIPVTSGVTWEEYPRSAWAQNGVRLSQAALNGYSGWLGHQHAPKPDLHGDPGTWPHTMNLFSAMKGIDPPPHPPKPTPVALKVDGLMGQNTVNRWAAVMGTHTGRHDLIVAVQEYLNSIGCRDENGNKLAVDGVCDLDNTSHATAKQHTTAAVQRHLGTPIDGVWDSPSTGVKALQSRLNAAKSGSKEF